MARRTPVGLLRDHRQPVRNTRDPEFVGSLLDQNLMYARRRAFLKNSIRRAADSFLRSGHADEALGLVVIRSDLFVGNRPVRTDPVARIRLQVVIGVAQRNAPVVIRPPAHNARPEPVEFRSFGHRVRLAIQLPSARVRRKESERPAASEITCASVSRASMRIIVRPLMFFEISLGMEHRSGFEERHADTEIRQDLGNRAASRSGSDDDNVVDRGAAGNLEHDMIILASAAATNFHLPRL